MNCFSDQFGRMDKNRSSVGTRLLLNYYDLLNLKKYRPLIGSLSSSS